MKLYFTMLSFVTIVTLQAQTVNHVLFTKGAELEYKTFSARPKGFKLELYEVTRITLMVTDVRDSNGVRYSYVTKKGTGISKPERDHYEKKYILKIENSQMIVPKGLYMIDTSYLADRYPDLKKGGGFYAATATEGGNFTFGTESGTPLFDYGPKSEEIKGATREFVIEGGGIKRQPDDEIYMGGLLRRMDFTVNATLKDIKNEGKASIKTAAGSFDCTKFQATSAIRVKGPVLLGGAREVESVFYFHPEIGFLKTETGDGKNKTGYIELARIKR